MIDQCLYKKDVLQNKIQKVISTLHSETNEQSPETPVRMRNSSIRTRKPHRDLSQSDFKMTDYTKRNRYETSGTQFVDQTYERIDKVLQRKRQKVYQY